MYKVGKEPVLMTCPNCRSAQKTVVTLIPTTKTHVMAVAFIPILLCWLPYVTKGLRKAKHTCSVCGAYIGISG
ncbi:hypothetical protein NQ314_007980 [Rhamnusium bicolor]|uniref:LITAF domain-containing protein n=1 Tax=Rhamnusium bicolor TaxID=1586634 RepID=A0AAV8YG14_9CUCU|nr:hypothetical protein NQ314_007980 [Rhamnusium bicolor]